MLRLFALLKRYNYVLVFLLLEVLAVVMITQQSYYQQSRIISWGNSLAGSIYSMTASVTEYFGMRRQNKMLAEENALLREQIASSYISYDRKSFVLNDTTYRQAYNYITAQVIKSSWNQPSNYFMINKGSRHGVAPDMAVISPQGIVGVVADVSNNFATVMTVLHPKSLNSVKIRRTDVNGTLKWEGDDFRFATVEDIPTTHRLRQGDTIITSGQDPVFPKGIMVGYIDEWQTIAGSGFYNIRIRLSTEFNHVEHVYVVHNSFVDEIKELEDNND